MYLINNVRNGRNGNYGRAAAWVLSSKFGSLAEIDKQTNNLFQPVGPGEANKIN